MRRLLLALTAAAMMSCDVCGLIQQEIVVAADDPDLGGLIADCQNGVPSPTSAMCVMPTGPAAKVFCPCLPLCQRVYAIVDPDLQRPPLEGCSAFVDAQGQARITIEYRSRCQ
jgi:hypothetical protein